jgi:hypothetical protein
MAHNRSPAVASPGGTGTGFGTPVVAVVAVEKEKEKERMLRDCRRFYHRRLLRYLLIRRESRFFFSFFFQFNSIRFDSCTFNAFIVFVYNCCITHFRTFAYLFLISFSLLPLFCCCIFTLFASVIDNWFLQHNLAILRFLYIYIYPSFNFQFERPF